MVRYGGNNWKIIKENVLFLEKVFLSIEFNEEMKGILDNKEV